VQLERLDVVPNADIQLYIEEAYRITTGKFIQAARVVLEL
jgi:hypothetical protein